MVAVLLCVAATATATTHFERLELLSDDPGRFLSDELPMVAARPGNTALRFLAQVQPVVGFGTHFTLGTSLSAWTPGWETALGDRPIGVLVAVPTRLGLPTGLVTAATYTRGALWVDLGVAAQTGASWRRPAYRDLRVVPTLGLGWSPQPDRAP
ncbi:MAG: hypothetical protein CL927_05070 [Deltaproteobacteria bacterium]|nr:hypothetical protein [Deltaproteobacteria bacterium]